MISARLRDGCGWSDARILNASTRGLLLHASKTPERGTYVEVCRGPHRIVARVVWVRQQRFGVFTQDAVAIEAITSSGHAAAPTSHSLNSERRSKRRSPTPEERSERSRRMASAMQFVWIAGLGVAGGTLAFDAVKGALSEPLSIVSAKLSARH
jgi:hypothetical protein